MDNNRELMIQRIENLSNLNQTTINELTNQIHRIDDESLRNELYDKFIKRVKEFIKHYSDTLTIDEIQEIIALVIVKLSSTERFNKKLLVENNFNEESILEEINMSKESDFDKINNKINSIDDLSEEKILNILYEMDNLTTLSNNEYNNLLDILKNKTKELISIKFPDKTEAEKEIFFNQLDEKLDELYDDNNYIRENDIIEEKEIDIINKRINDLNKKGSYLVDDNLYSLSIEELNEQINSYNEKINEMRFMKTRKYYNLSEEEIEKKIIDLNKELDNIKLNSLIKELNDLENIRRNKYLIGFQLTDKEKIEYNILMEKINILKEKINEETELEKMSIDELKQELKKLENPTNVLDSLSFGNKNIEKDYNNKKRKINKIKELITEKENRKLLEDELIELTNELNYRKSLLTSEEEEELTNLSEIKKAYYKIFDDVLEKHYTTGLDNINDFVNNHELINVINKYNNSDKLKQELINDIKDKLSIKEQEQKNNKITKKENNKTKWLKAIAAVSGFATGLGFSCIPGIGTITMGIAISKLAYSGTKATLNFFTKKNPDGRCTKIINTINTKKVELYEKTKEKYPVITEKVNEMRKKIRNFSEKYHMEYFLNGVAVGYLTGNMIDMITGETVLEHTKDLLNNNSGNTAQVIPGNVTTESIVESNTSELLSPAPTIDPSTISLEVGDTVDLSSISQGFISSDATESVNMMTNVAKNAVFDKAVELPNGNIRWHFKQLNGKYLGWYDAKEVQEILAKLAETSTKIVR